MYHLCFYNGAFSLSNLKCMINMKSPEQTFEDNPVLVYWLYVKSGFAVSMAAWSGDHGSNGTLGSSVSLSRLQYGDRSSALLTGTLWGLGQHYDLVDTSTEAMVVSFVKIMKYTQVQ